MSQQTAEQSPARRGDEPARAPTLTPYIVVSTPGGPWTGTSRCSARGAAASPYVNADDTIGHAELGIGDAVLMFAEASDLWPDVPVRAPESPATFSHTLHLEVDDVDASTERARRNGAAVERPPTDQPYGRRAVIVDPFGHRWILLRPPARASRLRPGRRRERDDDGTGTRHRAKEFYEAVLQVPFSPAHPGTWRAHQTSPPLGIRPSPDAEPAGAAVLPRR